jgi:hypothetical protein
MEKARSSGPAKPFSFEYVSAEALLTMPLTIV